MADNDFSAQFEKISDRAKTATDTLRAAGDKTKISSLPTPLPQEKGPPRQPIGSRTRPTVTAKRCRRSGRTSGTSGKPMSPKWRNVKEHKVTLDCRHGRGLCVRRDRLCAGRR